MCLVDFYQGVTKNKSLLDYILFVIFFPHILAGPIYQHKNITKQFDDETNKKINWENLARGLTIFIIGLAKKVMLADWLAGHVNDVFSEKLSELTLFDSWLVIICYTMQLYFDFSGYSDMAVGISQMLNINIPINFNSPYKAYGIIDFWNRWHMSLTNAITNYIYTPMLRAFNDITFFNAMTATFLSMMISGIWHGAGWTFVIFGAIHGTGLVINHVWKKYKLWMWRPLGYFLTAFTVLIGNVFFRAESVNQAFKILRAMFGFDGVKWPEKIVNLAERFNIFIDKWEAGPGFMNIIYYAVIILFIALAPNSNQIKKNMKPNIYFAIILAFAFYLMIFELGEEAEFVYFRF